MISSRFGRQIKALLDVNGVVLYGGAIKCSWEMEDEAPVKGKETAKK